MNIQSKFVKTSIAAAAMGFAALSAQAATMSVTPVAYAQEQFLGTAPAGAVITTSGISIVAATAIPAGSNITVMFRVVGGKLNVAPTFGNGVNQVSSGLVTLTNANITIGTTFAGATAAGVGTATATATGNNADIVTVQLNNTTTAVGIGGTLATINGMTLSAAGLATLTAVTVDGAVYIGAVAAPVGAGLPAAGQLEAAATATTIATSVNSITLGAAAPTTTQRIDVAATAGAATRFTTAAAGPADTGSVTLARVGAFNQAQATARLLDNSAAYTVAGKAVNTSVVTVTAPAGYFASINGGGAAGSLTIRANNANACGGAVLATAPAFADAATAAAATSVAFPATALGASATTAALDLCYAISAGNTLVISQATPSISAVLGAAAASDSADTLAATNGTALALNNALVDVTTYWPTALAPFGYTGYLRVTNTGGTTAAVTAQHLNPASGAVVGTPAVITTLAAGQSVLLTSAAIEAAVGTAPSGLTSGRLRVSGPTSGLRVQSLLQQGNSTPIEYAQIN